jgi:hypothetical protein
MSDEMDYGTGCPFRNWPDEYHDYGHTMMDTLLSSVRRDFPTMTPQQAETILGGTALVSVIRFTTLADETGRMVRGVVGFAGVLPLDPDAVEQGLRFCKAVDDGDMVLPLGQFIEADGDVKSDTARLLNSMALKRVLTEMLNFDIEKPLPADHPMMKVIDATKLEGGTPYDAGDKLTDATKVQNPAYALPWALSLQVMAGDVPLKGMRQSLAKKHTPLIACFCDVRVNRTEKAIAYAVEHLMEVGEIGENIGFYGASDTRPN